MPTDTATKAPASRRHPLQVTADRLSQHVKEYPQLFDNTPDQVAFERVVRRLNHAAENGLDEGPATPAFGPPLNPGQSVDQRVKR